MPEVDNILEQRGKRYGPFEANARVAQGLKSTLREEIKNGQFIPHMQLEAIDLIFTKISRAVTGDWSYADNWDDIAGYATLIANRLRENKNAATPEKA